MRKRKEPSKTIVQKKPHGKTTKSHKQEISSITQRKKIKNQQVSTSTTLSTLFSLPSTIGKPRKKKDLKPETQENKEYHHITTSWPKLPTPT
jgi:hypothetical protein